MKLYLKYILFVYLFLQSTANHAQIIVRLWEAEASATANVIALLLIRPAETRVKEEMTKLNRELKKQIPYYGFRSMFDLVFAKESTIINIRSKLSRLNSINNKVPLLFNRKKEQKRLKWIMYTDYLNSLNTDIGYGTNLSNNGNLLKTSLEIVSELEKIEKDLDDTLEDLIISERVFNLFRL
ncbi:hypothetical protein [Flavobacterium sp. LAR06]|uniref:hypothetical protein n=1 Tax=Flavobacterium sp. LAR06 TaxID=3064897 RepID=UPI0035C14CBC